MVVLWSQTRTPSSP